MDPPKGDCANNKKSTGLCTFPQCHPRRLAKDPPGSSVFKTFQNHSVTLRQDELSLRDQNIIDSAMAHCVTTAFLGLDILYQFMNSGSNAACIFSKTHIEREQKAMCKTCAEVYVHIFPYQNFQNDNLTNLTLDPYWTWLNPKKMVPPWCL